MDGSKHSLDPHSTSKLIPGGLYITFEGIECSGKTTQVRLLQERLLADGYAVIVVKQPGGTPTGLGIRGVLLNPELRGKTVPMAESLLYWADRVQVYETVVKPALAKGFIVLGDRDFDSSWAFQCYGRGLSTKWMADVQRVTIGDFKPKKTIYFDIPVNVCLDRINNRRAVNATEEMRIGEQETALQERIRNGYLTIMKAEPQRFIKLNGDQPIAALQKETYKVIADILR